MEVSISVYCVYIRAVVVRLNVPRISLVRGRAFVRGYPRICAVRCVVLTQMLLMHSAFIETACVLLLLCHFDNY